MPAHGIFTVYNIQNNLWYVEDGKRTQKSDERNIKGRRTG